MESRTSIETALRAPGSGGCPRPSLMWQFWQALVLNKGPRPSRAVVVEGAITQGLRKKLLPTLKSRRRPGDRLADGMENALRSLLRTVAAPPDNASPGSALVKRGASSHPPTTEATSSASDRRSREAKSELVISVVRIQVGDTQLGRSLFDATRLLDQGANGVANDLVALGVARRDQLVEVLTVVSVVNHHLQLGLSVVQVCTQVGVHGWINLGDQ